MFSGSLIVGTNRDPFSTVASMLRHQQVLAWCRNWDRYPLLNRFPGVTPESQNWYRRRSLAGRCAQR